MFFGQVSMEFNENIRYGFGSTRSPEIAFTVHYPASKLESSAYSAHIGCSKSGRYGHFQHIFLDIELAVGAKKRAGGYGRRKFPAKGRFARNDCNEAMN
jgi:hypothetical protein